MNHSPISTSERVSAANSLNRIAVNKDATVRFALGECSLGHILIATTEHGICMISLGDDPEVLVRELKHHFPEAEPNGSDNKGIAQMLDKIIAVVEVPASLCDLPLDIRGTPFQQRVWQALREIPSGSTASYSEIARRIGMPKSVRAVAAAIAANKLAVVIPCHRAIRSDGSLSGYRWGVERKRTLLEREAS